MSAEHEEKTLRWFAMRDLKRTNAKLPAYKMLAELGFEVFTPMRWKLTVRHGRRLRQKVPFMQDLLFVHTTRQLLDPVERRTPTLQYRFLRGEYCVPMVVRDEDMELFIKAVGTTENVSYYLPNELTPQMTNRRIRIIGGPLDGCEGKLLTVRGSRVKRLLVELPNLITVGIEVSPDYIELL